MTIVLLALVSLFALVITSRPILSDSDLSDFVFTSSTLQNTLQAPFQILPGRNDLKFDAARFHPQNHKQQIEDFSELNAENTATISSLEISPGVHPSLETLVDEIADRQGAFDTNEFDDSRDITDEPASSEPVVDEQQEVPMNGSSISPLAVLAFSCVAAFLALACIALTLYVVKSLRFQMLASKTAWEFLPHFWKHPKSQADASEVAEKRILGGGCLLLRKEVRQQCFLNIEGQSTGRHDVYAEDKLLCFDAVSDMESEWGDDDDKYQDALDTTPLPFIHDLPLCKSEPHRSHGHPPLLSMGTYPLDQPTSDRRTPVIRETSSSPISRPAWSVRAIDSPALGLTSREDGTIDSPPKPFIHPRRRAYRSAVPEFDIALAMQLRPGIGIGADSAWMVRFLMAIFGWFAVALTGNTR